jgi:hypothetical protein
VNWLVIFDNVEDPTLLEAYWPNGACGTIIVTTRNPQVARKYGFSHISVSTLTRAEGQKFLTSKILGDAHVSPNDLEAAGLVTDRLGHLPLALDIVRSYIASTGTSLTSFLRDYTSFAPEFLFNHDTSHWDSQSYQRFVDTTWTFALQTMNANARLLVDILSVMDSDGVPSIWFRMASKEKM